MCCLPVNLVYVVGVYSSSTGSILLDWSGIAHNQAEVLSLELLVVLDEMASSGLNESRPNVSRTNNHGYLFCRSGPGSLLGYIKPGVSLLSVL